MIGIPGPNIQSDTSYYSQKHTTQEKPPTGGKPRKKRGSPIKAGMKKAVSKPWAASGEGWVQAPHDHLTSISRLTFLTTVLPAHGADSTARVGRKELYAKEGQWAQRTGGQAAPGQAELWEAALGGSLLESEVRRSGFWSSLISSVTLNCS